MLEDEDILTEGNQLEIYLRDLGYDDFQVIKNNDKEVAAPNTFTPTKKVVKENVWNIFNSAKEKAVEDVLTLFLLREHVFSFAKDVVLNSSLMLGDDIEYVCRMNEINKERNLSQQNYKYFNPCLSTSFLRSILSGIISILLLLIYFTTWTFIEIYYKWRLKKCVLQLQSVFKEFMNISKKILQLYHDNETILERKKLSSPDVKQMNPSLVTSFAINLNNAVAILKCATCDLIKNYPLVKPLRDVDYISSLKDEQLETSSFENRNFSSTDIKKIYHLYILLQSELLRRLFLCFCPYLLEQSRSRMTPPIHTISDLTEIFFKMSMALKNEYQVIYYSGFAKITTNKELLKKSRNWKYADMYLSLHSATVQVQSVLYQSRLLEEHFEKQADNAEHLDDCFIVDVNSKLDNIQKEIKLCCVSYEDCFYQLKKLQKLCTPPETQISSEAGIQSCSNIVKIPVGYTELDPEVEDDIFEAYISKENRPNYECDDSDDFESKPSELHSCKQMMIELKSILIEKEKDWKERESRVRKRKGLANSEEADSVDSVLQNDRSLSVDKRDSELLKEIDKHSEYSEIEIDIKSSEVYSSSFKGNTSSNSPYIPPINYQNSLNFNSNLILQAVTKSKLMVDCPSETFCGYGENSSSEEEVVESKETS